MPSSCASRRCRLHIRSAIRLRFACSRETSGHEALPIKGRLNPSYGVVRIEYRRPGTEEWNVVEPLAWFEPVGDEYAMLLPGERTEQTVPIYFGDEGWTFPQPGDYEVRARLQLGSDAEDTVSEASSDQRCRCAYAGR